MTMEEIFKGTKSFKEEVFEKVQLELNQLGLLIYSWRREAAKWATCKATSTSSISARIHNHFEQFGATDRAAITSNIQPTTISTRE
ncbi:hypothetical protein J5N97_026238 [Dioscorea zingiberensis]|uniref:Flotillin-like n=1 Tax=Dioscorea zingiberensis TaxID=325984 RepID=A0A9D5H6L3_9LILI|nr:hypothetical protein J5N97_026238 [Dioscorea zingiberensis]